ncbi:NAD-dependent epimerase/dehydratase family protein [bacterium]|nr:NAD-dependent epimerase/dehydratase family protein [bacterium]
MKIALLGSSGYLGQTYAQSRVPRGLSLIPIPRDQLDYSNPIILRNFIRREKVDGILNCAGFTGRPTVDACEDQQQLCFQLNVLLPELLAKVSSDEKTPLIQIGSGCIYQGNPSKTDPNQGFREEDQPNFSFDYPPCSYYSGTKAEMEKRIGHLPFVSIWRLRMPFSSQPDDRNLLQKLAKYPKVLEARNSLTDLNEMVSLTLRMLLAGVPSGIYNLTNPGVVSNSEIVEMLVAHGLRKLRPSFFSSTEEISMAMRAPRSSCVLDSSKIARLGFPMCDVREALARAVQAMARD